MYLLGTPSIYERKKTHLCLRVWKSPTGNEPAPGCMGAGHAWLCVPSGHHGSRFMKLLPAHSWGAQPGPSPSLHTHVSSAALTAPSGVSSPQFRVGGWLSADSGLLPGFHPRAFTWSSPCAVTIFPGLGWVSDVVPDPWRSSRINRSHPQLPRPRVPPCCPQVRRPAPLTMLANGST